ncbi:Uma2 family endonuclease [Neobacillus novalis]|uniref:Uma2 family endonuclease n=1 Tax=Neobacillus novalis TaxID=220687 RepID=A0AA95MPW4_9BACI|nr:Uma2 family endonuclease [Neobacillus novalis]WHY85041.1 Uma2 family endonuclease [Neobacillus novalis]
MSLPQDHLIKLEEFYKMREETDKLIEYIDGNVFMSPSPSTKHQRVSSRLHVKLFHFLEGKSCEVFPAPFDIELHRENMEGNKIIIPDLSVICDKSGLTENRYVGAPALIMEILSPSNQSHDLVFKLNLYMQYGVREYWIINPMLNTIQAYVLDSEGQYQQLDVLKEKGILKSAVLEGLEVSLEEIF